MTTSNNLKSLNLKKLSREERLAVKAFSKLLKRDEQEIINIIDLFSDIDFHLARIFECLSEIKEEKRLDVLISLEYLLKFDKTVKDVMEE